jgi:hypothetical protein
MRAGIRSDEFDTIARQIYIESAVLDITHSTMPSRARIAAFTGLCVREVHEQFAIKKKPLTEHVTITPVLIEVLQKWHTTAGYGGPYGIPLALEFGKPPDRCIQSLVALVNADLNPQVVLEELLQSGAIRSSGNNRFQPVSRFLLSTDPNSPTLIDRFGAKISQYASTLEYNIDPKHTEKRLDRNVFSARGVSVELVPAFERYARAKISQFLTEIDNWIASELRSDAAVSDTVERQIDAGINVFFYMEPLEIKEEPLASLVAPSEHTLA